MKDIREINVENIGYSFPRHTKKGYNVLVNYAGTKPITVKTPVMKCLYGVDQHQGKCIMKLDLSNQPRMREILTEIDERLVELPEEYKWFENPEDSFYYTPHLKDCLRVQLPMKYNRIHGVEIIKEGDEEDVSLVTVGDIKAGTLVQCELEWKNVWIIDQTFGYFWSVKKIYLGCEEN